MSTTFTDCQQRLADSYTFVQGADRIGRLAKLSIGRAYSDISGQAYWNYLRRRTQINVNASYSTGTIAYTASTRTLTLTGGTFPTNATSCDVIIARNVYTVETRTDGTHLVLTSGSCPVDDIASGTAYSIVQTQYILPADFVELRGITELSTLWRVIYCSPEQMLAQTQWWGTPTTSWYYTILGAGTSGRMYIQFAPPPSAARTFSLIYQAKPRPPVLTGAYSTGTIATTAGSTTATITGGSLPVTLSSGCILRIGATAAAVPSGIYGDNPYTEELIVKSRTSATVMVLQEAAAYTTSGVRYSVDDPIDIEPTSMNSYFDRLCEARLLRMHPSSSREDVIEAERAAAFALKEARAADARLIPSSTATATLPLMDAMFFSGTVVPP